MTEKEGAAIKGRAGLVSCAAGWFAEQPAADPD